MSRSSAPGERRRRTLTFALLAAGLLLALALRSHGAAPLRNPVRHPVSAPAAGGLVGYDGTRSSRYVARAISGEEDPLFIASPGGAVATAARVERLRGAIDAAARAGGIDPAVLEGLVFVESAGRPDAMSTSGPAGAAGLTQILPGTATSMLGLHVDLAQSGELAQEIADAHARGASAATLGRLGARLAAADQRFDPAAALRAAVRYLQTAKAHLGREDLAVASYHMGLGNLARVLDDYDGGSAVAYPQLFFDTAPDHHRTAYIALASLSDQSPLYLWRVLGAAALMRLFRTDRAALVRLQAEENALGSGAEVLHPPASTPGFADAQALANAYASSVLDALPSNLRRFGVAISRSATVGAAETHTPAGLFLGLRPAAATLLEALGGRVHALAPTAPPLTLTSAVTDRQVQRQLGTDDPTSAAGWSFTLARPPDGPQSTALDAVLGRMEALDVAAITAYPSEIEVTASADAPQIIASGP